LFISVLLMRGGGCGPPTGALGHPAFPGWRCRSICSGDKQTGEQWS